MPEDPKRTSPEVRGAVLALAAGCAALVVSFGAAALIRGQPRVLEALPPSAPPPAIASGQLVRGRALFLQECVSCHGSRAQGGIGPDLRRLEISDAQISKTITAGAPPEMPAYGRKYRGADIDSLTKYIRSFQPERKLIK